jgi:hypothetical protein
MAVKAASDRLLVKLLKSRSTPTSSLTIEVRLARGDVDATEPIVWAARSSAGWLRLGNTTGTVYSNAPVAAIGVVVNATGLNDTFTTGPLNATIAFTSNMPSANRDQVFEQGSNELAMIVELSIISDVSLELKDVTVQTADASALGAGGEVAVGSKLIVTVVAFDYERLPISRRDLQIEMSLEMMGDTQVFKGNTKLAFWADNKYRAEVPPTWIEVAGSYHIKIASASSNVTLHFTVSSSKQSLYIALGISSVRPLGLHPEL